MRKISTTATLIGTALIALCAGFAAPAADDYGLPSIGDPADNILSPADEQRIGSQVVKQLREQGYILDDPELTEYLNRLGAKLAAAAGHLPSEFSFFVIDDPRINAFALPGGYIGVNSGLILASESESELAGVIAHEIAHVTQRHIARQIEKTGRLNLVTAAAILLAIIAGGGNPDVVEAAVTLGLSNLGQQSINYTRAHEKEADRLGISTLAAAGFSPGGMASFFSRLQEQARLYGNELPEILRTHPISTNRIAEARSREAKYRPGELTQSESYGAMRSLARVRSVVQATEPIVYFQNHLAEEPTPDEKYGLSQAYLRTGRVDDARELSKELVNDHPENIHYALALARAQLAQGNTEAALTVYESMERLYPQYLPLILAQTETMIQNGQAAPAKRKLLDAEQLFPREPQIRRLLSLAAQELNQTGEAHYQMAQYFRLRANYPAAINQIEAGLENPDISENDRALLKTTLARAEAECERQLDERTCEYETHGKRR